MKYLFEYVLVFLFLFFKAIGIVLLLIGHMLWYPICLFFYFLWTFKILYFNRYRVAMLIDTGDRETEYVRHEPFLRMLYRWITLGPTNYPKKSAWDLDMSYKGKLSWEYFSIK